MTETLHEPPPPGESVSPCCGRRLSELPRHDRIITDDALVTCGRLSAADALLLSGQLVVLDPRHDEIVFTMAATVAALGGSSVPLRSAHEKVGAAIRELVPTDRPLRAWTTELMVLVTSRAQELAVGPTV